MPTIKMLQSNILTLKVREGEQRTEWVDEDTPGLYLLTTAAGKVRSFFIRPRIHGKLKHILICHLTPDTNLAEVRRLAVKKRAEVLQQGGNAVEVEKPLELPIFDDFFTNTLMPILKSHNRSANRTEEIYRLHAKEVFGHQRVDKITRQAVVREHGKMVADGFSPASADHFAKTMRMAYNKMAEYGVYSVNPLTRFPLFNADNKVEHYLDKAQLEKLLAVLHKDSNKNVTAICRLLLSSGCRLGEILSLQWADVASDAILIRSSVAKSGKRRSVPINSTAKSIIESLDTKGKYAYLFINPKTGKPYTTIMKVWSRLRNKAGLPHLRIHDLRHQYASFLVNSGRSIYEVKTILGHADIKTTERYAHLSSKTLQDAANSASAMIEGAMPVAA